MMKVLLESSTQSRRVFNDLTGKKPIILDRCIEVQITSSFVRTEEVHTIRVKSASLMLGKLSQLWGSEYRLTVKGRAGQDYVFEEVVPIIVDTDYGSNYEWIAFQTKRHDRE